MTPSFRSKVRVSPDVLVSELDGESVLLNLRSQSYFGLDEVGTRFFELLTMADSVQAAYETLLSEYDIDEGTLRVHLTELLEYRTARCTIFLTTRR
jgi:hypothetical protein